MAVWEKKMQKIPTPEKAPRLFDLVKVEDPKVRLAFYFALRDTLVAKNLEEATRIAFQKEKRWRVVTLQGQIIEVSGTMTGGGGKVMKGRMGSSVVMDISEEEISKMEAQLQRDSKRAVQCQEEKSQLEEAIRKLQQDIREMRNTSEKYTASIQGFSEQELDLKNQIKELEANVAAAAPDKTKQKELEKVLDGYKKDYERVAERAGKMEEEVKTIRDAEHALQSEALSIKLKIEQIDSHISTHQGKIKHWQKEISKLSLHPIEGEAPEELRALSEEELDKYISFPFYLVFTLI